MSYPWLQPAEEEFAERLVQGRLPHALLLSGPRGTGKKELASQLLAGILCLDSDWPACGNCRSCQLLATGAHPDCRILTFEDHPRTGDLRKELIVDQVRGLISSLNLTNTISRRKAALIYPAEAMNTNAANALLKTLEEPPGETVIILVCSDTARLPATIRSRCQNLTIRQPEPADALDWLQNESGLDEQSARAALQAATGSPLEALRLHREGATEQYLLLTETLAKLEAGRIGAGSALAALADVEPDRLWSWISLLAAGRLKSGGRPLQQARELSKLQSAADLNRKLVSTPVRKDFLLQDWLIQWARISA